MQRAEQHRPVRGRVVVLHLPGGAGNRHFVRPLALGNQVKHGPGTAIFGG